MTELNLKLVKTQIIKNLTYAGVISGLEYEARLEELDNLTGIELFIVLIKSHNMVEDLNACLNSDNSIARYLND